MQYLHASSIVLMKGTIILGITTEQKINTNVTLLTFLTYTCVCNMYINIYIK